MQKWMWRDIDWMTRADNEIIHWFAEKQIIAGPATIARNLDYHPNYVGQRLLKLTEEGFLVRIEEGWYRPTEKAIDFASNPY